MIATGIFAEKVIGGAEGLIEGSSTLLVENIILVIATMLYSLIVTLILLKALDIIPGLGLRSAESEEDQGLDVSDHGERGYVADGADN